MLVLNKKPYNENNLKVGWKKLDSATKTKVVGVQPLDLLWEMLAYDSTQDFSYHNLTKMILTLLRRRLHGVTLEIIEILVLFSGILLIK